MAGGVEPRRGAAVAASPALPLPHSGLRGWLTMGIYQPLFLLALLVYGPVLLWRFLFDPAYRRSLRERLGYVPVRQGEGDVVWLHGVSVAGSRPRATSCPCFASGIRGCSS